MSDVDVYIQNLTLLVKIIPKLDYYYMQRKFVRDMYDECPINYGTFREWIETNYNSEISEPTWAQLIEEDKSIW